MTLKRDGEKDCLHLNALPNPETRRTVKSVVREMLRQSRRLGGIVLPPMLQLAEPGRGFHCGGSFPMREDPRTVRKRLPRPTARLDACSRGGRDRAAERRRQPRSLFPSWPTPTASAGKRRAL